MQCSKCSDNPTLKKTKVHSPSFSSEGKNCAACGVQVSLDPGYFYCDSCKNYFVCNSCRICTSLHFLVKVVDLENINPDYDGNQYGCNICGADKTADDNGIWHCGQCFYDVCGECLE